MANKYPSWAHQITAECRALVLAHAPAGLRWAVEHIPVVQHRRGVRAFGVFDGITVGGKPNLGEIRMNMANCVTAEQYRDTLMHEFAHALVHWEFAGEDVGGHHGLRWKWWMKELGRGGSHACR